MAVIDTAQEDPLMRAIPIMTEMDQVLMENLRQATKMRELGSTAKVSKLSHKQLGISLKCKASCVLGITVKSHWFTNRVCTSEVSFFFRLKRLASEDG